MKNYVDCSDIGKMRTAVLLVLSFVALAYGFPTEVEVNSWRVVGGVDALPGQANHQVSLRSNTNSHFCGGSIITPNTVVSAAHCLLRTASSTRVVAGTIFLNTGGDTYNVERLVPHPEYNSNLITNDVGVVITSSAIQFGALVSIIPMQTTHIDSEQRGNLTGWGRTSNGGPIPNNLQRLELVTITHNACRTAHSGINQVFESQVCTYTRSGEGACHGDSGGPLECGGELVGIVSWGVPCARGYPDVFARVSSFYNWIMENSL